jgi:hypothetical protein
VLLLQQLQSGVQVDAPYTSVTVPGRKLKDVSVDAPYASVDVSVSDQLVSVQCCGPVWPSVC